ncbi:Trp biosynthesis-associated membrane protein [Ruania halotolerans]|uniref:Trp biosynthesis-associated membrane protein n=1 Tax=Ruania halotolerans TaxID=2897773 RepID=UPI001E2FC161|nr:Trp biosynthesis-associated membrane protein [Ruania halotolerans]UFU08088.1 Trp biosynthesis-associated membrane protein [Ruania halotolerans]
MSTPSESRGGTGGPASHARTGLSRRTAVLILLVCGALLLGASVLEWAHAPVRTTIGSGGTATVTGADGAPVVPSVALLIAAAGLAIGLAGRITRVVAAVAAAIGGILAVVASVAFLRDPMTPVASAAAELTGVRELGGAVTVTAVPWIALALGVVVAVLGVLLPARMGRWAAAAQRYERAASGDDARSSHAPDGPATRMAYWDALSRGEDPTDR